MQYLLRPCTDADHAWAYALKCDAYREVVEQQFGPWDEAFQRQLFDQLCWKPAISHIVLVAEVPAGLVAWEDRGDHLWLDEIQIVREWRGRGLGTTVLRDLLTQADTLHKPLRLHVLRENTRAQILYRRLGFDQLAETSTHLRMERRESAAQSVR
jgi:ribosomal protein S18 acetylase RimI-like enzyme